MTKPEPGTVSAQLNVRFKTNENCPQVLWIFRFSYYGHWCTCWPHEELQLVETEAELLAHYNYSIFKNITIFILIGG